MELKTTIDSMGTLLSKLPEWVKSPLRNVRGCALRLACQGTGRYCPVCGKSSRRFCSYGVTPRKDALCVYCQSVERHRFLWLYLQRRTDLFDGSPKKMLHVAPELCFEPRLGKLLGAGYLTADLVDPLAMVKMDVTSIGYPDRSFDVICCSHVLEHVPDDRKAMREFRRVLADDGWAILLVPITSDRTFEDPAITEPSERRNVFGQEDHVRRYGPDYADRLREAGFTVEVTGVNDLVDRDEAARMGLSPESGLIHHCTR
jgi:SAM-dependent methyltransferase